MLHREIPFVRIVFPLCAGIVSRLWFDGGSWLLIILAAIAVILLVVSFMPAAATENHLFGISFIAFLTIAGHIMYDTEKQALAVLEEKETIIMCTLSQFPEEKENSFKIIAQLKGIISSDSVSRVRGSILLYSNKKVLWDEYKPGDIIAVRCKPERILNRRNPFGFDYSFYMERSGIKYYAFINADDILIHRVPSARSLLQSALIVRHKIINMYEARGITGETLATVAAVTLGEKRMLDPDQKQSFITAGVMHIMAVSGLHAVIISIIVMTILSFMKNRLNWVRLTIAILVLWIFSFITGLTPSVLRATLMFTFLQAGSLLKRPVNPVNSVLASAFILILVKPSVIFEAGFLLSYSAVIFIICFYRDLYTTISPRHYITDKVWQLAAVSLVAQAGTLPLTISMFNRFPTYFLVANILIVPLSSLMILLGCLVPLTYPLVPVSEFFAWLLKIVTEITVSLTMKVASLPMASVANIGMTTGLCISLSIVLFLAFQSVLKPVAGSYKLMLGCLFGLILYTTLLNIRTRITNELIVYCLTEGSCVGFRSGKTLYVYYDGVSPPQEVLRHCSSLGLKPKLKQSDDRVVILRAPEAKVLISPSAEAVKQINKDMDLVILTGPYRKGSLNGLTNSENLNLVIASSAISQTDANEIKSRWKGKVWFTCFSGAFIQPIASRTK